MGSIVFGALALAGLVGAAASALAARGGSPLERARSGARSARTRRIADLVPGELARVTGRVTLAGEGLLAPLSGRRCAHYELVVGALDAEGLAPHVERASTALVVDDATGLVHVDAREAIVEVVLDVRLSAEELDDARRFDVERVLLSSDDPHAAALFARRARLYYAEGVLEPGELVTAHGLVGPHAPASAGLGYRDRGCAHTLVPPGRGALYLSDSLPHE